MTRYAVVDPTTNETVEEFGSASDAEVAAAVDAAASAYSDWARSAGVGARSALVALVAKLHEQRREELADAIVTEMGKPLDQALGEVDFAAAIHQYYADHAAEFLADETIELDEASGSARVRLAPLGVLLGIMPWNFPAYQVARFAAPNLVLGNTIVLKHAPQCPRSASIMADIFAGAAAEVGAPAGVYSNIYASEDQAAAIIADPRVQGVSVTGSERAGSAVAEIAGRHLKKVALELGGSDPFILLSTDDLEATVTDAVNARLDNSGQSCNAAKRFVVIDSLFNDFAAAFTERMRQVAPGDPRADGTVLGPLSSAAAADRLSEQLDRAKAQGATVLLRGERNGTAVGTAVLSDVTPEMDAYREEFFGPVAVIYRAADEADAVRIANDTPFGLGSYLYTNDPIQAERVADLIDAGMVWVNLVLGDGPELPFGGVKRSGTGRELGRLAISEFANRKLIRIA